MVLARSLLIVIIVLVAFDSMSQCNLKGNRGENKLIDANQFPYTTFYRNDPNGSFRYNRSLSHAIDTFRSRLKVLILEEDSAQDLELDKIVPYDVYSTLFTLATGQINAYDNSIKETNRQEDFSWQLKAKAFILLCATVIPCHPLP